MAGGLGFGGKLAGPRAVDGDAVGSALEDGAELTAEKDASGDASPGDASPRRPPAAHASCVRAEGALSSVRCHREMQ
ncbi:hypothetical protein Airi02_082080 [Actinoallomurus iriomotensis]|uniref:Uncharacterized protein n=1 Tax=Actinoallomurus iriomotensis TaxID=478107 RepID=A0A9W6W4A5_9ACTN|nr:hypothetical protein Airi02_082080 [Actinoallomurus iriomotensis]